MTEKPSSTCARRRVVAALGVFAGAPLFVGAQILAGRNPRVGILLFSPARERFERNLRLGLRDQGYVEGRNIELEWRSAEGRADRLDALAAELVRRPVDVIVAEFTPSVLAAKRATNRIPIVAAPAGEPVATGIVASLAHPGGNVTGYTDLPAELAGKRIELLRELVPTISRVGLLLNGTDPIDPIFIEATKTAAGRSRLELRVAPPASSLPRLEAAFAELARQRVDAVLVPGNLAVPLHQTAHIALAHRLPSISNEIDYARAGGLMAYGASLADIQRRSAITVARLLNGADASRLPIERPTTFELVINTSTAKGLHLAVPESLALRADELIS